MPSTEVRGSEGGAEGETQREKAEQSLRLIQSWRTPDLTGKYTEIQWPRGEVWYGAGFPPV